MSNLFGLSQPLQDQTPTVSSQNHDTVQTTSKDIFTGTKDSYKCQFYTSKGTIFVFISLIVIIFSHPKFTQADNLYSSSFEIKMGTINITGGEKNSSSYRLTDTVGQTAQGEFNSSGYTVKAGFQYINSIIPFTFVISNLNLDFGSLVPGTPSILTNTLTVTTGSAYGFTVRTIEDHPLRLLGSLDTIPDTSCNLVSPCTLSDATPWTDNTRYGFGYNVSGTDTVADFVNSTYFRPFPIQGTDNPIDIMSRSSVTASSVATVSYKVNVSGSQPAGIYQNAIQFIAIPSF